VLGCAGLRWVAGGGEDSCELDEGEACHDRKERKRPLILQGQGAHKRTRRMFDRSARPMNHEG